jgi:hypothetical protein
MPNLRGGFGLADLNALTLFLVLMAFTPALSAAEPLKLGEISLRTPCVCKSPDGTYYLTGTSNINSNNPKHQDFKNNDGVRLWKSKDLDNWEEVGLVWNFATDGASNPHSMLEDWVSYLRPDADNPDNNWHHGATDVRLQRVKGKYYIVLSANHYGVVVLESAKDDPVSSYTPERKSRRSPRSRLTVPESYCPAKGSLFEDDDGSVYLLWDGGLIVKLTPDLSDFAETPWNVRQRVEGFPDRIRGPDTVDPEHFFLLKRGDFYHLFCTAWILDGDQGCQAVLASSARDIRGPYSNPRILVKVPAPATIAMDGPDAAIIAFSKDDHPVLSKVTFKNGQPVIEDSE